MSGRLTSAKLMLLGLSVGLIPCMASAVDMPVNALTEAVDTTHLGEVQEGVTARAQPSWTVQVGAYADKDKAEAQLEKLASDRPGELRQAARLVTPLKWDDTHTLYRARFAGLSLAAASSLCASLNGVGQACFLSQADKAEKPVLREMVAVTDDMRGAGLQAPAMLVASTAALKDVVMDMPELSAIVEEPVKAMAPKLVALNDRLTSGKSGQVSNAELSGMRGGFFTAAGAQFDFGASIRTMVNGQLALQTNLTWTPQGPDISSLSGLGQQITDQVQSQLAQAGIGAGNSGNPGKPAASTPAASTPASLNDLGNAASNAASNPTSAASNIASPAANLATGAVSSALNSAANTPGNSGASPVSGAGTTPKTAVTIPTTVSGVNIPSPSGGSTQVLANISANQIQSIILNSASGQTISQNTNVTLTIYNLPQLQQQLAQHALSAQLVGEIMAASGLGH
jgi:sporulation related protein